MLKQSDTGAEELLQYHGWRRSEKPYSLGVLANETRDASNAAKTSQDAAAAQVGLHLPHTSVVGAAEPELLPGEAMQDYQCVLLWAKNLNWPSARC